MKQGGGSGNYSGAALHRTMGPGMLRAHGVIAYHRGRQ